MSPKALKEVKKRLQEFLKVIETITKYWDSPARYKTMTVLLQNMAFYPINCVGYDHEKEVAKLRTLLDIFRRIKEYEHSHLESWIYEEVDGLIMFGEHFEEV